MNLVRDTLELSGTTCTNPPSMAEALLELFESFASSTTFGSWSMESKLHPEHCFGLLHLVEKHQNSFWFIILIMKGVKSDIILYPGSAVCSYDIL